VYIGPYTVLKGKQGSLGSPQTSPKWKNQAENIDLNGTYICDAGRHLTPGKWTSAAWISRNGHSC
jgi:hypothetical protein